MHQMLLSTFYLSINSNKKELVSTSHKEQIGQLGRLCPNLEVSIATLASSKAL
jgi:hypothetical protein